jgi:hypothetical protein
MPARTMGFGLLQDPGNLVSRADQAGICQVNIRKKSGSRQDMAVRI